MDSSFAVLLGRYRVGAGLTQEELADRAGLSAAAVSSLERGARRFPQRRTIQVLADALELTGERRETFIEAALRRRSGPRPSDGVKRHTVSQHQLPAALADFTGRADDVKLLTNVLTPQLGRPATSLAAITGMGGIGKTVLAVEVAHAVAHDYPDGQLYLDLRGFGPDSPMSPNDAVGWLLRALGTPADEIPLVIDEAAAKYRTAVAGRRLLMVLDNARDIAQVGPLLPGSAGSAVILTSRRAMSALPGVQYVHLDALSEPDGLAFLRALVGAARVDKELDSARAVVRCCALLPLGIRMAGARLAARPDWPVSHLAQRLEDERRRLDELERDDLGVRASLAVSIEQLAASADPRDRNAASAFSLLGVPDGPDISLVLASRLLDSSEREAERTLERLVDLSLVEASVPGRYRLHDLVRVYARERAAEMPTADQVAALTRAVELYIGAAWRTLSMYQPAGARQAWVDESWMAGSPEFRSAPEALEWLDGHRPHLVAATRQVIQTAAAPSELGVMLALGLFGYYAIRRHWLDWVQVTRTALGPAESMADKMSAAMLRHDLGLATARVAEVEVGSYEESIAYLRQSLADTQNLADARQEAVCLTNLGLVLELAKRFDEAIECGERALDQYRKLDDPNGQATARGNLASAYGRIGDHQRQLAYLQETCSFLERVDRKHGLGEAFQLLAGVHRDADRYDMALGYLQRAARAFRDAGDLLGVAETLNELGAIQLQLGDQLTALATLEDGLEVARRCDDDGRRAASILHRLGIALLAIGRHREAENRLGEALAYYEDRQMSAATELEDLLEEIEGMATR